MSDAPAGGADSPEPHGKTSKGMGPRILFFVIALISALTGAKEVLEMLKPGIDQANAKLQVQSIYAVHDEIDARMNACDYRLLIFCKTRPPPAAGSPLSLRERFDKVTAEQHRIAAGPAPTPSKVMKLPYPLNVLVGAAITLPRLPSAFFHVLAARWSQGALGFWIGVVYLLGYVALVVVATRTHIIGGAIAVLFGGFVVGAVFWLLQHLLAGVSAGIGSVLSWLFMITSFPGLILVCFPHHMAEAWEAFLVLFKSAKA